MKEHTLSSHFFFLKKRCFLGVQGVVVWGPVSKGARRLLAPLSSCLVSRCTQVTFHGWMLVISLVDPWWSWRRKKTISTFQDVGEVLYTGYLYLFFHPHILKAEYEFHWLRIISLHLTIFFSVPWQVESTLIQRFACSRKHYFTFPGAGEHDA